MTKHPCYACAKVEHPEAVTMSPSPVFLCGQCTDLALVLIVAARLRPEVLQDLDARMERAPK